MSTSHASPETATPQALSVQPVPSLWLRPWLLPVPVALLLAGVDQLTKVAIIRDIPLGGQVVIVPGFLHLVHLRNTGAAWSLFEGYTGVLSLLSIVVVGAILLRFRALAEGSRARAICLSLLLGGVLGNLVDRVFRGEVVDFVLFFYRSWRWPAFNVADTAISCSVAVFVLLSMLRSEASQSGDHPPAAP